MEAQPNNKLLCVLDFATAPGHNTLHMGAAVSCFAICLFRRHDKPSFQCAQLRRSVGIIARNTFASLANRGFSALKLHCSEEES